MPTRLLSASLLLSIAVSAQTLDLGPITAAEKSAAREPVRVAGRALRKTGIHRRVSVQPAGGNARFRSEGAEGVRLHVTGFDAGDGTLYVRAPGQARGDAAAYTGLGPNDDGEFWSQTVFGEELLTEFVPGPSGAPLKWSVPEITHGFGPMGFRTAEELKVELRCAIDVNCHAELNESSQSVAMYYFEIPEGQSACTGALVRTKSGSGVPYFLTAHHCISDQQMAATVETFWNYQTSSCNGKTPDLKNATRAPVAGSRFVVSQDTTKGDFSMIVLNSIPAIAKFAEADPRELALGEAVTSISHPLADWKRAAFGTVFVNYWDFDGKDFPPDLYYQVLLKKGSTHPGSSGSPLFSKPNTIAGMLSHGPFFSNVDICAQDPKVDGYAKLSLAWPYFQRYLDDPAPSTLAVSPAQVGLTIRNGAVENSLRRTLVVNSTSTEPVPVTVSAADVWMRVLRPRGTAKAGSPFATEIEFRPELLQNRSGLLRSRLEVVSGNNGRVVPVDADIVVLPSDVVLATRASAAENDDCRYRMELALTERGGIATNLTALWLNGEDFTSRIGEWFGSTELAPKASLRANLKICWPGQLDGYRVTIAGRDAGSGRSWSSSSLVDFP